MCINVLRPRPRPFKFGWVSISLCYATISVFCPASSAPLSFQYSVTWFHRDQYLLYVFMYSWVYNAAPQSCFFHAVWSTTHWWQTRWRPILFSILYGVMYQEAEFATNIQTGRTSSDFNENQPKHQNRNFLKTFYNYLWWNLFTTFISPLTWYPNN